MKKFATTLSIALSVFFVSSFAVEAYDGAKIENINGSTQEITATLNKKVFKKSDDVVLVNQSAIVDAVDSSPLASSKGAPLVVSNGVGLGRITKNYLQNMGVKNVTIVGGLGTISKDVERNLQRMGINVSRVRGKDRYDTSLNIAREIYRTKGFDKAFIVSSDLGLENVFSIYAYATKNHYPIVWADEDNCNDVLDYFSGKNLKKIYVVGDQKLTGSIEKKYKKLKNLEFLKQINKSSTDIDLIDKFYTPAQRKKVYTANVDFGLTSNLKEYVSLGVVAAKDDAPVLVCNKRFSHAQDRFLKQNNVNKIIEVGDKVTNYSVKNTIFSVEFVSAIVLIIFVIAIAFRGIKYESK